MDRSTLLAQCRRVVVKVGTNVLVEQNTINAHILNRLAADLHQCYKENRQILLVTSGAVGMGAALLNIDSPVHDIAQRQACAAVGQPHLMQLYHTAFQQFGQPVGQVLLTRRVLRNRRRSANLHMALSALFSDGVLPICNENDSVAIAELDEEIGDNDLLGALLARTVLADVYIILTDVDGLHEHNPTENPHAETIKLVHKIDNTILARSDSRQRGHSRGGMRSKLLAAKIAQRAGCNVVIANGSTLLRGQGAHTEWTRNWHAMYSSSIDSAA